MKKKTFNVSDTKATEKPNEKVTQKKMDSWIVTANTTSTTSTTGTTSIASTSVTTVTSTSTAANAQTITKTCTTPTQKRNLNVVQSPESNADSPYSNTSEVFTLNIRKRKSLADFVQPSLIQETVPVEIHRVDQSCSGNEEKLIESDKRKRQCSIRKNNTKNTGENIQVNVEMKIMAKVTKRKEKHVIKEKKN